MTTSPGGTSPLPPFPPELPHPVGPYGPRYGHPAPSPTRYELLAHRAEALRILVRRDLSPLRLGSGALLTLAAGTAWFSFIGAVDDLTRDQGDVPRAVFALIVGVLVTAGCALALTRGWAARRRRQHLLYAWAAWHQHPAVQATPVAHVPDSSSRAPGHYALRSLWVCVAALTTLFGLILVARGADEEQALHAVGFGGLGLLLLGAAARGTWKALRLAQRVRFTGIDEIPGAEHLSRHTTTVRGSRPLGWKSLRDPDTRFGRFTARTPAWAVLCGSALLSAAAAATAFVGGYVLALGVLAALVLSVTVGAYDHRGRYAVPALIAGLCMAGFGWGAGEAQILADRGVWIDGVVTDVRVPKGRGSTSCGVQDADGEPLPQRVSSCTGRSAGDRIRVIVDPENDAAPALTEPAPVGLRTTAAFSAVVFVASVTAGMSRGHHNRRLLQQT
ncbi:hypothetical protein DY218_05795 [Streptomyces triticagri]|uniref:Uncharacterized protein n=1 Tax=Streptomyces triticagri TaxID=2293568 RepID=A0A372MB73_9ACTN|nr:hypothetical protein [Streptomyces triticagri]RFU87765.1 hypothetical protein DY218_05795 [Streptomyces triticagri]